MELLIIATNLFEDFTKALNWNKVVEELEKMFEHSQFDIEALNSEDDGSNGDSTNSDFNDSESSNSNMSEAYH